LQVISSFNPLHEFSQRVGQDKVDVKLLVPVGVEPHDWEPTIKDVQEIQKSDLIIINGIGFENWVDNLAENNYRGIIIDTSDGILINNLDQENTADPHIWLNPVYAKKQVQNIALAFSNHDPENGEFYHANAAQYSEKLDLLDSKIRTELSNCNDDFIAFHNAFSYFAEEYNLNQYTIIPSSNSHGEVTAKTLENVISKARELNIKVIFSEESVNTKTSQIIANEIGGKVLVLSPLEIVSDGDYILKMNQNLENLKEALC
jgi:zinc transport system substrate-binding protein